MNIGKENEYIEFKKSTAETEKAIMSMSAMLNKHGKGAVYFGVKDDGTVTGQIIGDKTLTELSRDISRDLKPSCVYDIDQKKSADGKDFIEVSFHGNRSPYSARGRYFLRFHDEDRQMDNEMLRQFYLSQRQDYSEWENADSEVSVAEVDEKMLKEYVARGREKGRLSMEYSDLAKTLGKLGLLYDDSHLNNAGNVLFSARGPIRLKLAKFASETRLTVLDLQLFEGNVYECIEKCMDYVASNINWRIVFEGKTRREEIPEIPMQAIREIVVNAFSHGEYDSETDFELDIYSNRICIYSPGIFPKPYKPEDFAKGNLEPIPMNRKISDILFRDGTIEQISTGFERTFKECERSAIRYEYTQTATGFRFTFFREGMFVELKLSETDKKVLEMTEEDNSVTVKEIAASLGVTERTVQRSVKKLREGGVIKTGSSNKWETV